MDGDDDCDDDDSGCCCVCDRVALVLVVMLRMVERSAGRGSDSLDDVQESVERRERRPRTGVIGIAMSVSKALPMTRDIRGLIGMAVSVSTAGEMVCAGMD